MRRTARLGLFAAFAASLIAPSRAEAAPADPCDSPPPAVSAYLQANSSWRLVRIADLSPDDQKLWSDAHRDACPGFASGDFEGRSALSFALALWREGQGRQEKLILLRQRAGRIVARTIVPAYQGASPEVVWRAPPGAVRAGGAARVVRIKHDSIMFEELESASQRYYFANSRLHKIQLSD